MATVNGDGGVVEVGGNAVASITSFSLEVQGDTIDSTVMGTQARTFVSSKTQWQGTLECYWDPDDSTGQEALTIGAEVSLSLEPEGNATSGDTYYTGTAIVTGIDIGVPQDGMVTRSISFQGTAALTTAVTA